MAQPSAPVMGDPTNLGIRNWVRHVCKHDVAPTCFSDLQIAFKAAFPHARHLEESAWPELIVCGDQYSNIIGSGCKYNQWPMHLQEVPWGNDRKDPPQTVCNIQQQAPLGPRLSRPHPHPGEISAMTVEWIADPRAGGESDQIPITTTLHISTPAFISRR